MPRHNLLNCYKSSTISSDYISSDDESELEEEDEVYEEEHKEHQEEEHDEVYEEEEDEKYEEDEKPFLKNIKERMYINRLKRAYILYNHFVEGNKILCSPEFGSRENLKKYKYDEPIVWLINQEQNRKKIENELVFENFKNIKQKPICYMFHSILDINMLAYYKYMFHFPENFGLRLINCFKETILEPKDQVLLSILKEKIEEEKLIPLKTVAIKLKVKEFSNRLSLDNDILNKQLIKTISTEKLVCYFNNILTKLNEQCEQLTRLKDTADLVRREIVNRNDATSV